MSRARRRSRWAFLAPLLVAALALTPLSAALAPTPAAADSGDAPVKVTLSSLEPLAPQPGETLTVRGTLTNVSTLPVSGLAYELKIGSTLISAQSVFDAWASDPDGDTSTAALTPLYPEGSPEVPYVVPSQATLQPGSSETFEIKVDTDSIKSLLDATGPIGSNSTTWQVRELAVTVSASVNSIPTLVGHLRTFLPWAPTVNAGGNGKPTPVAWVWPLTDRPHRNGAGTWFDDSLAGELGTGGRLLGLVDAGRAAEHNQRPAALHPTWSDVPVSWAIDPMLASEVKAMTAPYVVSVDGKRTAGTGGPAAKIWLARLKAAVSSPRSDVLELPYADPDVVAAIRAGLSGFVRAATLTGRADLQSVLGDIATEQYGWPVNGLADQRTVNALAGDGPVILSGAAVKPLTAPAVTPSAHTQINTSTGTVDTLLTNPALGDAVNSGANDPDLARVALQRYLSETLLIQREGPFLQRPVVVAPNRRWSPTPRYAKDLLLATGRVPWIQPVSLATVDSGALAPATRDQLTYPDSARHNELTTSYLNALTSVHNNIAAFGAILPQSDGEVRSFNTAVEQALSSGWRTQPALAAQQLDALRNNVNAARRQVRIATAANSLVTLTSHGGRVPVTISNNLSVPVQVRVRIEPNQRLSSSSDGELVQVLAHQQKVVDLHASAKTSGIFTAALQLRTPDGAPYGPNVTLRVRSTVYGTIALAITGAATAALLIAVIIRLTRRAMAARRGDPTPAAG